MTRDEVLAAVRDALGATRSGPPARWQGAGFPKRRFRGDIVARFREELEAVAGECHGPVKDWRSVVRRHAGAWGCDRVFGGPGIGRIAGLGAADRDLAAARPDFVVGVARAEWGIAESGTVVVEDAGHHLPTLLTAASVVLLDARRIVWGLEDLEPVARAVRNRVLITGPARTSDIEKRLVLGAHGPRRMAVVLVRHE